MRVAGVFEDDTPMKRFSFHTGWIAWIVLCLLLGQLAFPFFAAAGKATPGVSRVADNVRGDTGYARRMDKALDRVLKERRYTWRLPRETVDKSPERGGWLSSVLKWIAESIDAALDPVGRWIKAAIQWLKNLFPSTGPATSDNGTDWRGLGKAAFYVLGITLAVFMLLWAWRWWRRRQPTDPVPVEKVPMPVVDLSDEGVAAQDLPTGRWLTLAQEMMENGDYRHALRALYLSVISVLADTHRLIAARHKSNRDYYRELARHAHDEPEVLEVFHRCMRTFERAWYGMHPVSPEEAASFLRDRERIDALVHASI